jgi:hypothetical protein
MKRRHLFLALVLILLIGCSGAAPARPQNPQSSSRCVPASVAQMNAIRTGVKHIDPKNNVKSGWAVKSKSFDNVWFVAAKVYEAGMENGSDPGVWAISGSQANPGMSFSVNGYAQSLSSWPDASMARAGTTMADDGAEDALSCAKYE